LWLWLSLSRSPHLPMKHEPLSQAMLPGVDRWRLAMNPAHDCFDQFFHTK
jgi:hypothetical protein